MRQRKELEKDAQMAEKDKLKALNQLKKKEAEMEKTLKGWVRQPKTTGDFNSYGITSPSEAVNRPAALGINQHR